MQAVQWTGSNLDEIAQLVRPHKPKILNELQELAIYTPTRNIIAAAGDWIIRHENGELSYCRWNEFSKRNDSG